ncbi:MAG: SCP2 sterol-binding domain-containing protein [Pseudomonadota bacterium]
MTLDDIFEKMPKALNPDAAAGVDATIQFNAGTPRNVVIRDGALTVNDGAAESPTVSVTMAEDDLVGMLTGKLDGMTAFMTGKLKIDGDLMFAQKITSLFDAGRLKED